MLELALEELQAPEWPLRPLDKQLIAELMRSIRTTGLLQPIVVRRCREAYEVVFGNHRLEACRRLGIERIHVVVRSFSEEESFLARLSENLLRNSFVDPIEEAQGYAMLVRRGWTINAIGEKVGKCDSYVCERIGLLERLSKDLRPKVSRRLITASHAELISRISDRFRQNAVAQLAAKEKLSVRSLEDLLNGVPPPAITQSVCVGDECCIRFPKEFAEAIGIETGSEVFVYIRGRRKLIIQKREASGRRIKGRPHNSSVERSHVRSIVA